MSSRACKADREEAKEGPEPATPAGPSAKKRRSSGEVLPSCKKRLNLEKTSFKTASAVLRAQDLQRSGGRGGCDDEATSEGSDSGGGESSEAEETSDALEESLCGKKDLAKEYFHEGQYVAAARLFAQIAEETTEGVEASKEYSNEAASLLMAAVATPDRSQEYARSALNATTLALRADAMNYKARLRHGKVLVLLGDLPAARSELEKLFYAAGCDEGLKREALEAHEKLKERHPSVKERRLKQAAHLNALGLSPDKCSTPDVKKNYRRQALRNHPDKLKGGATSRRRESINKASSAFRAAQEAYDVLLPTDTRRKYLFKFDVIGRRVDLGPDLGKATVLDFNEPTDTHLVQIAHTGRKLHVTLKPPE